MGSALNVGSWCQNHTGSWDTQLVSGVGENWWWFGVHRWAYAFGVGAFFEEDPHPLVSDI